MLASLVSLVIFWGAFFGVAWLLGWVSRPRSSQAPIAGSVPPPTIRLDRPEAKPMPHAARRKRKLVWRPRLRRSLGQRR